jgi:hypothetical protein
MVLAIGFLTYCTKRMGTATNNTEGGSSRDVAFPPRTKVTGIPRLQLSLDEKQLSRS